MHFRRDFNKVAQQQFGGVCDQDCTAILLKVPSKWFLVTVVGSARRVTRHMAQILAPHYAARIQSPPDFGQFPRTRLFLFSFLPLLPPLETTAGKGSFTVTWRAYIFFLVKLASRRFLDRVDKKFTYCIKILYYCIKISFRF